MTDTSRYDALLDVILSRRSIPRLVEPAPDADDLARIIRAAGAAPDYGRMRPWRFIVITAENLPAFAEHASEASLERAAHIGLQPSPEMAARSKAIFGGAAPMILAMCASIKPHRVVTPAKQQYAVAAAAQNALLAATALGYGSMWRTGPGVDSPPLKAALGLSPDDVIVGFLFLGTIPPGEEKPPHDGGDPAQIQWWTPPG